MSSLVGYWPFDEGSGTTANDLSGSGNTGTLVNSPTWESAANCKFGSCLNFNGVNQYVQTNGPVFSGTPSSFTMIMWFKRTGAAAAYGYVPIATKSDTSFILEVERGGDQLFYTTYGCVPDVPLPNIGSTNVSDGDWHEIGIEYIGGKMYPILDGQLGTGVSTSICSVSGSDTFAFGAQPSQSLYSGENEQDIRYYSGTALSASAIAALYQSSVPDFEH
jgi:hypothetical protein